MSLASIARVRHYDAIVIGAGIFGSLIAKTLMKSGRRVLVVDDRRPDAGSPPAACLMRPSWFSSLGKNVYQPALKKLDELVGVKDIKFATGLRSINVHWCDPKKVLLPIEAVEKSTVERVTRHADNQWLVQFEMVQTSPKHVRRPDPAAAPLLVVAAGIWTPLLFPEVAVQPQAGIAWLWPKERIEQPFINAWAPYKQVVAFNRGDGLWVGDGTSVREWTSAVMGQSLGRCAKAVGFSMHNLPTGIFGYRPYAKEKPCVFREIRKGLWIATGGAKNGTLAAGWCADQMERAVS